MDQRVALIIGGSRGIGRAVSIRLAKSGYDIWLNYHSNHEAANKVKNEINSLGRSCELLPFDISDYEKAKQILDEKIKERVPYAVVFNAAIAKDNLMVWMTKNEWDSVLTTNLDGFYNVIKPVLFSMLAEKQGRIVVVSSVSGQVGQGGQVNYSASKAGLIGAAKALAKEVGRKKVFVNVVSPGLIETDMTTDLPRDKIIPLIPMGKFGKPEDIASVVDFLCTEENMYIHGQVIGVNGGLAM